MAENQSTISVFKFGGASLRNADGFRNVARIVSQFQHKPLLLIASALGKTTNALERVVNAYFHQTGEAENFLQVVKNEHVQIMRELFKQGDPVFDEVNNSFVEIDWILENAPDTSYDYVYDQLVSIGEMASTKMLAAWLNRSSIKTQWLDVRDVLRTDETFREARVQWPETTASIMKKIPPLLEQGIVLTQGFLGGTPQNLTTTLGREGSDYTAAIFAHALDAAGVTIWKDVPGVLTADPRQFPDAKKMAALTYLDAIEMTYYGATVIHPNTIKPLQNKNIPLVVRSFIDLNDEGTRISADRPEGKLPPVFVRKSNQCLMSVSPRDFSFMVEENLGELFSVLALHRAKVNLIQHAAVSFSICMDELAEPEQLTAALSDHFSVKQNSPCELLTIRHYADDVIEKYTSGRQVLLEQKSRNTAQFVLQ